MKEAVRIGGVETENGASLILTAWPKADEALGRWVGVTYEGRHR